MSLPPTLDTERDLFADGYVRVAGMDEVGRGALAGPVTVGVAVVGPSVEEAPARLRDSKLLRPAVRVGLVPEVEAWALTVRTGSAAPAEIDALGILGALRLAGRRALAAVPAELRPDLVLLDGAHDWLSEPAGELVIDEAAADGGAGGAAGTTAPGTPAWVGPVRTVVKGDTTCASIAAASVVAKVERDAVMVELDTVHPAYGWAGNKGYGSAVHRAAIAEFGACRLHRRSWNLGVR